MKSDINTERICPKCGQAYTAHPALSRTDNETLICDLTDEQIERYKKRFWNPEMLIPTPDGMVQVVLSD